MSTTSTRPEYSPESRAAMIDTRVTRNRDQREMDAERTANLEAHRAEIEARYVVPTFRVPNSRVQLRLRGRCPFCAGTAFNLRLPSVDIEHPHVSYRGRVCCLLCSRTVAHLQIGGEQGMTFTQCPCGAAKTVDDLCASCAAKAKARKHMTDWRAANKDACAHDHPWPETPRRAKTAAQTRICRICATESTRRKRARAEATP